MNNYHDYLINDGCFIGKFEEMYQNCENPWNQLDEHSFASLGRDNIIEVIRRMKIHSLVEVGCGLGALSNRIYEKLGINILGIDISPTAVNKAKKLYQTPENKERLAFKADNALNIGNYKNYDAYLFSEIMWYILDDLDNILDNMKNELKGKYFLCNQSFYKGTQKYGVDKFTNLKEFIGYIPFKCLGHLEIDLFNDISYETVTIFEI